MAGFFRRSAVPLALAVAGLAAACGDGGGGSTPPPSDPYAYRAPPPGGAAGLEPSTWVSHLTGDLTPYWTMDAAKGTPAGNFPTYRTMTGATTANGARKPRMLGRQTYAYAIAYMMTGEERYLDLARAGTRWIIEKAWDATDGGWYPDLDADGNPSGTAEKWAQDFSYTVMGPAAYFYVTRDPAAEAKVLATRDLLFDPAKYWDAPNARIKDGLDDGLTQERYMSGAGSWELVAQLDPVTAFMLLVQPVLSDPVRRTQVLSDLRTLGTTMRDRFYQDGFMWGTTGSKGIFGSRHADFGHGLKAYWALTQIDKRLDDRPFASFLASAAPPNLTLAYDADWGRWAKRPTSATTVEYGSDWWIYAEEDQFAATVAMHDPSWIDALTSTATEWRTKYVDRTPGRLLPGATGMEVYPSISRGGSGYGWGDSSTAKANEWKSAFHSHEHALVMYLFSHWISGTPVPLYFAFPAADVQALAALTPPYTFQGKVASVEDLGALVGDPARHKVRVTFTELR